MQSSLNYLKIDGVVSEIANNATAASLSTTGTSIEIGESHGFHDTIGGSAVSASNPSTLEYLELKKMVVVMRLLHTLDLVELTIK